ncbi:MAG: nucleotidyltransferase domain-containing protein [Candidatus Bathyarchaeia archaeon]
MDSFLLDGNTLLTDEDFIFNVFGYEHPKDRVFSFLKYFPLKLKDLFNISVLERKWIYFGVELLRAEKLYTADNYKSLIETFKKNFPNYVYFCLFRGKEVISVPLRHIKKIFVPRYCLQTLIRKSERDRLQEMAVEIIMTISSASKVPIEEFGLHGSIALDMHGDESDIDIVVYGGDNFRKVEAAIGRLVKEELFSYVSKNRLDNVRKYRVRYKNRIFMYTAVRRPEEINVRYGQYYYTPIKPVKFMCRVRDDSETMFRPAIYEVEGYSPLGMDSDLPSEIVPRRVVSMVGCYRNVARRGDMIKVSGILERVKDSSSGRVFHQVVVGTAEGGDEYIWPYKT